VRRVSVRESLLREEGVPGRLKDRIAIVTAAGHAAIPIDGGWMI
jgi:hypothetical protein